MQGVTVVDHPLVQHKLTLMRDKTTPTRRLPPAAPRDRAAPHLRGDPRPAADHQARSRRRSRRWTRRSSKARSRSSPRSCAPATASSKACSTSSPRPASPISASTAIRETLEPVEYYFKAPEDLADRLVIVVDPMLATANSAVAAIAAAEGARRQGHPLRLPARRAGRHRALPARPSPACRSTPPRSTSTSTTTATSFPASATPATGCTGRSERSRHPDRCRRP